MDYLWGYHHETLELTSLADATVLGLRLLAVSTGFGRRPGDSWYRFGRSDLRGTTKCVGATSYDNIHTYYVCILYV